MHSYFISQSQTESYLRDSLSFIIYEDLLKICERETMEFGR